MSLPTPLYDLKSFSDVYEPSEDTFLFLDALESELSSIRLQNPTHIIEIGSGSGIVITCLAKALRNSCFYYATDINPMACSATLKTATLNQTTIECINMNLLENFRNSLFDVILFNPPYVVTEQTEIDGHGLNRAWAGGKDGREIIDQLLPKLTEFMCDKGTCYMVTIKENRPEEIVANMLELGFDARVIKERKILGEHLFVLRFNKVG